MARGVVPEEVAVIFALQTVKRGDLRVFRCIEYIESKINCKSNTYCAGSPTVQKGDGGDLFLKIVPNWRTHNYLVRI